MSRHESMSDYAVSEEQAFIKGIDKIMTDIMDDIDWDITDERIPKNDGHLILLGVADHLEEIIKAIRG